MRPTYLFLLLSILLAVPMAAQIRTFDGTASVVVVEVPVTVTQGGRPLRGLSAENFLVMDGGKRREPISVEEVDLSEISARWGRREGSTWAPVPVAARRHFLMLFDLMNSRPESIVASRDAARELVERLHPSDLVAVALFLPTRGAEFLVGFTSDREQVDLALLTLGSPQLLERRQDPVGLYVGELKAEQLSELTPTLNVGNDGFSTLIWDEWSLQLTNILNSSNREAQLKRVSAFTEELSGVARSIAHLEGAKQIVFFSEGLDRRLLFGGDSREIDSRRSRESGEIWNVDGDALFGRTQVQNELESMTEAFRRAGAVVQAVDIGRLRAPREMEGRQSGQDSLLALADGTGGELYSNHNQLGDAVEAILERTSVTYLLSFQPDDLEHDGAFRRLKVRLRDVPRGTRVSHRAGYYAPRPFAESGALERRLTTAEMIMGGSEGGAIGVEALVTAFPVDGEKAYVPVLLEVDGPSLLKEATGESLAVEVYAYAFDEDGSVRDFFGQNLNLSLDQVAPILRGSGLKHWGHFDLDPGEYTVRLLVRAGEHGGMTLLTRSLSVTDVEKGAGRWLPPLFPDEPGKWLLTREGEARRRDVAYPFMRAAEPYVPALRVEVPADGSVPISLLGFGLAESADVSAQVVSSDGRVVSGAFVEWEERAVNAGVHSISARLRTKGISPGEYRLVVTTRDAGVTRHASSASFVVAVN